MRVHPRVLILGFAALMIHAACVVVRGVARQEQGRGGGMVVAAEGDKAARLLAHTEAARDLRAMLERREGHAGARGTSSNAERALPSSPVFDVARPKLDAALSKKVHTAYFDVYDILGGDNSCSAFYGGPAAREVLNALVGQLKMNTLDHHIGMRMSGMTINVSNLSTGINYRLFQKMEINSNGPFEHTARFPSDPEVPAVGGFEPNTREARALILLHELGHLISGTSGRWLLPDDGRDFTLSSHNTNTVASRCREQIRALRYQHATPRDAQPDALAEGLSLRNG